MKHPHASAWSLNTRLVHGHKQNVPDSTTGIPTTQPIYASTTYLHHSAEALDQAFLGSLPSGEPTYVYARNGNPNAQALEETMAQAEGGVGSVVLSSGMAAIHTALLVAGLGPNTRILVSQDIYGSTLGLLRKIFAPLGVEIILCNLCGPNASDIIRAIKPDVVYIETLSNPLVKVIDLAAIGSASAEVGAISVVDSTFTTPYIVRPLEHGFDLVLHSATKYLGGHGDSTAGVVVSASLPLLEKLRSYATMLGAMLSPFESHLITRGMKTLGLRMERHCSNALHVAYFLQQHPAIERVYYPGLSSSPQHELATQLFDAKRYGGLLSFDLKQQSRESAFRFMDSLQLILPATTLGDVYSLVSYPPMSSHRSISADERHHIGISDGCIRLSVGIEDVNDIIADLHQALTK